MTTWRKELERAFLLTGDNFNSLIIECSDLDKEFPNDWSGDTYEDAPSFMAWSDNYVYHSHEYDSTYSIAYVRRNPPLTQPQST